VSALISSLKQVRGGETQFLDATIGPGGVIESRDIDVTEHRHLIRLGFAFRATPGPSRDD
jgi:hypothetical protein